MKFFILFIVSLFIIMGFALALPTVNIVNQTSGQTQIVNINNVTGVNPIIVTSPNIVSFNQTWSNLLYYPLGLNPSNYYNSSSLVNVSQLFNNNLYYNITTIPNFALVGSCPFGQFVVNTTSGGVQCATPSAESEPNFNGNYSRIVFNNISNTLVGNQTIVGNLSIINGSIIGYLTTTNGSQSFYPLNSNPSGYLTAGQGGNASFNQSLTDSLYNTFTNTSITFITKTNASSLFYLLTNPYGFYNSTTLNNNNQLANGNLYYNSTSLPPSGNQSFNQSLTDSLYYPLTNPYGFYNSTTLPVSAYNASWNESRANLLYYSILNPLNFINATQGNLLYYPLGSNPSNYYNSTSLINVSQLVNNNGYYNVTTLPQGGNSSWNETRANSLYVTQINGSQTFLYLNGSNENQNLNLSIYNLTGTGWNWLLTNWSVIQNVPSFLTSISWTNVSFLNTSQTYIGNNTFSGNNTFTGITNFQNITLNDSLPNAINWINSTGSIVSRIDTNSSGTIEIVSSGGGIYVG